MSSYQGKHVNRRTRPTIKRKHKGFFAKNKKAIIATIIALSITVVVFNLTFGQPADKDLGKAETALNGIKDLIPEDLIPEDLTKDEMERILGLCMQIDGWYNDMRDDRKGVTIPIVSAVISIIIAIVPILAKAKLVNILVPIAIILFICTILCICLFISTYMAVGSTYDQLKDIHDNVQPMEVSLQNRIDAINNVEKAKIEADKQPAPPQSSVPSDPHVTPSPPPTPFPLNLEEPYLDEFFSTVPAEAQTEELLAQCIELSYIEYQENQQKPFGFQSNIDDADEDEKTYFDYYKPKHKYEKPYRNDRFDILERAILSRINADLLYEHPEGDVSHTWYASAKNRSEIANDYTALGLDYYNLRNDYANAKAEWEKAILWQCRSLRSWITEKSTNEGKKNVNDRIIALYEDHLDTLNGRPGINDVRITRSTFIAKAYRLYAKSMDWE